MADLLPAEALAFLDAIAGPESRGQYTVRFGGKHFSDMSDHPRVGRKITSGPNKGKLSTAAGRYQITQTTWDNVIQPALHLPDFSPESQDIAAWYLAQQDYKRKGGGDLLGDLRTGDPAIIGNAAKKLAGTWTSLPGGIEQGTTTNRFRTAYANALQERMVSPEVPPPPNRGTALGAIQALLGTSEPTAEAYAPSSGSLTASALATGAAEPVISRTLVDALRATKAQPVASGTATNVSPVRATDIAPVKATDLASLSAVEPRTKTIQATDLNPDTIAPRGPNGRGSIRPRETPRITEGILRPYAETYVPTKERVATQPPIELTTRKVTTVPVDANGTVTTAPKVSLQEALNRVAEKRRQEVVPVKATDMTFSEINKGKQPSDYPTIQPTSTTTTLRPLETKGVQVAEDLTPGNLPPGYNPDLPFGAPGDLTRLTAQPGSPLKVPYGPPMPPKTVETAAPTPAPWMPRRQQPIVHADPSQPRIALTNPTAQEVVNGIGKGTIRDTSGMAAPTAALMSLVNSPNAQLVGQVNSGQHQIIGALMRMFGGFGQPKGVNGNLVNALAGTGNSAILAAQRDWLANASTEDRVTGSSPLSTYGYDPHTGTVH